MHGLHAKESESQQNTLQGTGLFRDSVADLRRLFIRLLMANEHTKEEKSPCAPAANEKCT